MRRINPFIKLHLYLANGFERAPTPHTPLLNRALSDRPIPKREISNFPAASITKESVAGILRAP